MVDSNPSDRRDGEQSARSGEYINLAAKGGNMTKKNEPHSWLFDQLNQSLDSKWENYREVYSNTKGDAYEETFKQFLESYFEGSFDVRTKVALIDAELDCFDSFDYIHGEDEIDVVGLYKQAVPKIVFETDSSAGSMQWVPYDGVALVAEVKNKLTKSSLDSDLDKLEKISKLKLSEDRFISPQPTWLTIDSPVRCLVYDECSISDDALEDLLKNNLSSWHMVLIASTDVLILNGTNLPFGKANIPLTEEFHQMRDFGPNLTREMFDMMKPFVQSQEGYDSDIATIDNALYRSIVALSVSTMQAMSVQTVQCLEALTPPASFGYTGATTSIDKRSRSEFHPLSNSEESAE